MKKLLTGILFLALAASMSVPAFAANNATNDGTAGTGITVNGKYQAGAAPLDVISVDVVWEDMNFEYTEGKKIWNPKTHKYDQEKGSWSNTPKNITFTNHSNIDVRIKTTAKPEGNIKFNFTETAQILESAEGHTTPASTSTGVMIEGGSITENGKLGTITVGIYRLDDIAISDVLKDALENGGDVLVVDDMVLGSSYYAKSAGTTNLNLNGKKLTFIPMIESEEMKISVWNEGTVLNIKNGEIVGTTKYTYPIYCGANAVVNAEDCTFSTVDGGTAVKIENWGNVNLKDCTVTGNIEFCKDKYTEQDGTSTNTLTLSGNIKFSGEFVGLSDYGKVICLAGTYNFDPTDYVDATLYDVTANAETGIWTVTAK